jgi:hypothetical protein
VDSNQQHAVVGFAIPFWSLAGFLLAYWVILWIVAWVIGKFLVVRSRERAFDLLQTRARRFADRSYPYLLTCLAVFVWLAGTRFFPPTDDGWNWARVLVARSTWAVYGLGLAVMALRVSQHWWRRRDAGEPYPHGGAVVLWIPLLYGSMYLYWIAFALLALMIAITPRL